MPTYGYECLSCDNQFETFQSIKDDALKTCDVCGGSLRKRIYPVGISFKGDGFYVNDYAAKSEAKAPKAAAETPATEAKPDAGGASEPGNTEAKPDSKSDPKPEPAKAETKATPKSETKTPAPA
jgi:putative FmdB family regulatory protein